MPKRGFVEVHKPRKQLLLDLSNTLLKNLARRREDAIIALSFQIFYPVISPVIPAKAGIQRLANDISPEAKRESRATSPLSVSSPRHSRFRGNDACRGRFRNSSFRRITEPMGNGGRPRVFVRIRIFRISGIFRISLRPACVFPHNRKSRQDERE